MSTFFYFSFCCAWEKILNLLCSFISEDFSSYKVNIYSLDVKQSPSLMYLNTWSQTGGCILGRHGTFEVGPSRVKWIVEEWVLSFTALALF